NIIRNLTIDGKIYTVLEDGTQLEGQSVVDVYANGLFPETFIHPGTEVMPNKFIEGEELNVIKYTLPVSNSTVEVYEYFAVSTGLRLWYRQIGGNMIMTQKLYDYKAVDGILMPHKVVMKLEFIDELREQE